MKVTNWIRNFAVTLFVAGWWVPSTWAAEIPLADPSFEAYTISVAQPAGSQYAYASQYRPTSGWVDDQDHFSAPYVQDTNPSNWLYTTAYADKGTGSRRASPRTGNQAMHGLFRYSSQVVSDVFEAGKTYTFSIYAQGDHDAEIVGDNWASRVFLYMFDASLPFSEANSLTLQRYSPPGDTFNQDDFDNRDPDWTPEDSQAGWRQISLSWTVLPGAPEIGHNIGVGFWAGDDVGLDDASLSVVPEPSTVVLVGLAGVTMVAAYRRRRRD